MIMAPPHMDITLTFLTFDLENDPLMVGEGDCKYDWLEVWDGLPQGELNTSREEGGGQMNGHTHTLNIYNQYSLTHAIPGIPACKFAYRPSISRAAITLFDVRSLFLHSITFHRGNAISQKGAQSASMPHRSRPFPWSSSSLPSHTPPNNSPLPPSLSPGTSFLPRRVRVTATMGINRRRVLQKPRSGGKHFRVFIEGF